ncbi:MAG: hypothetical protein IT385_04180 [Deltaproteobacteria bacterium]|nr:hypothetical protein [Deltaproteobacteria bacterium]
MTRLASALLTLALLPACGDKPKPKPAPPPSAPQATGGPVGSLESAPPNMKTTGGVDLTGAADPVRVAALQLATNRKKGVDALVAAGKDAGPVVVRLLGSAGLNELLGALEIVALPDDPAGAHAGAMPGVLALLGHDAPDVRAAAARIADGVQDPAPFIVLAKSEGAAGRVEAIRLLGRWSGAEVEATLLPLLGTSEGLALEAALALGAPGKTASPAVTEAAAAAARSTVADQRLAGFVLSRRLGLAVPAEAIDQALADLNDPIVAEAIRAAAPDRLATIVKTPDAPPLVRRVVAEQLGRLSAGAERDALVDAAAADPAAEVRATLAPTLVAIGEGGGSVMDKLLVDDDAGVRRAALAATTLLPAAEAVTRLRARLAASSDDDKNFILWALGRVPDRSAVDLLIDNLTDPVGGPVAGIVLQVRSGKSFSDVAAWRAWADEAFPPAPEAPEPEAPKPEPTPPK